jgi:hypothetical protein
MVHTQLVWATCHVTTCHVLLATCCVLHLYRGLLRATSHVEHVARRSVARRTLDGPIRDLNIQVMGE